MFTLDFKIQNFGPKTLDPKLWSIALCLNTPHYMKAVSYIRYNKSGMTLAVIRGGENGKCGLFCQVQNFRLQ